MPVFGCLQLRACVENVDVLIWNQSRERGHFDNRRYWGIEMNEARQLYLGTYSRIDSIDHLVKNCRMEYR